LPNICSGGCIPIPSCSPIRPTMPIGCAAASKRRCCAQHPRHGSSPLEALLQPGTLPRAQPYRAGQVSAEVVAKPAAHHLAPFEPKLTPWHCLSRFLSVVVRCNVEPAFALRHSPRCKGLALQVIEPPALRSPNIGALLLPRRRPRADCTDPIYADRKQGADRPCCCSATKSFLVAGTRY
jgi:hypothetical protein